MLSILACFIPGGKNVFSIKIDETERVDQLKDAIKLKKAPELDDFAMDALTSYRGTISNDKKTRMNELKGLDDELQQLSEIFRESPPAGKIYVTLVQTSEGQSVGDIGRRRVPNCARLLLLYYRRLIFT